jgi:hypothetical protein
MSIHNHVSARNHTYLVLVYTFACLAVRSMSDRLGVAQVNLMTEQRYLLVVWNTWRLELIETLLMYTLTKLRGLRHS